MSNTADGKANLELTERGHDGLRAVDPEIAAMTRADGKRGPGSHHADVFVLHGNAVNFDLGPCALVVNIDGHAGNEWSGCCGCDHVGKRNITFCRIVQHENCIFFSLITYKKKNRTCA